MLFRHHHFVGCLVCCLVYAALTCPGSALLAIALYAIFKIVGLLIDVLHGLDQVNKRMDYIGKSLVIQGVLTLAAFCSVFAVTASLEFALASMAIVTVLVGVLYDFPRSSRFEALKIKISRKKTLHLLKYCLPIVVAAVACAAAPSIPRQFLSFSQGEAALGIYASVAAPVASFRWGRAIYTILCSAFSRSSTLKSVLRIWRSRFARWSEASLWLRGVRHRFRASGLLALDAYFRPEHRALHVLADSRHSEHHRFGLCVVLQRSARCASVF